jgi:hypothetical protein
MAKPFGLMVCFPTYPKASTMPLAWWQHGIWSDADCLIHNKSRSYDE